MNTGVALRPELHSTSQILEYAKLLDEIGTVSHVFIPDIPGGLESIEISAAALTQTKNLKIGSGVIRLLEHDNKILQRRLETIQSISKNRFILGIGTGNAGPNPKNTITKMISQLEQLRANFGKATQLSVLVPETFVATLKKGIAKKVVRHCESLLLNFCSPEYANSIVVAVRGIAHSRPKFACYLKVFYAKSKSTATRLLIEEFSKYNLMISYHEMFVRSGIAQSIAESKESLGSETQHISKSLLKVSLVNPSSKELKIYVDSFREAGIDLPCIYPFFVKDENHEFKMSVIRGIADLF